MVLISESLDSLCMPLKLCCLKGGEVVYQEQDFLSCALNHINVEVLMWVGYFCFALVLNRGFWQPLKETAGVAVGVQFLQVLVQSNSVVAALEGQLELRLGGVICCTDVHLV